MLINRISLMSSLRNVGTTARAATPTTRSLGLPGVDWWQKHVIAHLGYAGKRDPNKLRIFRILKTS